MTAGFFALKRRRNFHRLSPQVFPVMEEIFGWLHPWQRLLAKAATTVMGKRADGIFH
ncbi:hypothetical protein [Parashewanella tropica]|uniref:hypothetical protein n=1 Tax=Parashewanella tropica TaxID=2547970 RepID=UPI0014794F87|nr:hypothetical protein [Parashewanella tropica]